MSGKAEVLAALARTAERADRIADSLTRFEDAATVLSSEHPRLIDEYPNRWVAVSDRRVLAHGDTIDAVLEAVDRKGIDRASVIVRLIERNQRTLIL